MLKHVICGVAALMIATFYGEEYGGGLTASGEVFDPYGYTAASNIYPMGTELLVCYDGCVAVVVNDVGPGLDISKGAALAIGMVDAGRAPVDVTVL
jgi:rare lipoprotein A